MIFSKKLVRTALSVYWTLCFILTHISIPKEVPVEEGSDKILHLLGYTALAFIFDWHSRVSKFSIKAWRGILLLALYGAFDEWTQGFFGRDPDRMDWATDVGGILLGTMLSYRVWRRVSG